MALSSLGTQKDSQTSGGKLNSLNSCILLEDDNEDLEYELDQSKEKSADKFTCKLGSDLEDLDNIFEDTESSDYIKVDNEYRIGNNFAILQRNEETLKLLSEEIDELAVSDSSNEKHSLKNVAITSSKESANKEYASNKDFLDELPKRRPQLYSMYDNSFDKYSSGNSSEAFRSEKEPKITSNMEADSRSVFIRNVDYNAKEDDLVNHFKGCGTIKRVTINKDWYTGKPKGSVYIEFSEKESVSIAVTLDQTPFYGRNINVTPKRTNQPGISSTDYGYSSKATTFAYRGRFNYRGYYGRRPVRSSMRRGREMGGRPYYRGRGYAQYHYFRPY